jgi:hypothetical protein
VRTFWPNYDSDNLLHRSRPGLRLHSDYVQLPRAVAVSVAGYSQGSLDFQEARGEDKWDSQQQLTL